MSAGTCRAWADTNVSAIKLTGANTPHDQILKKTISTQGYTGIVISFCFKWDVLEDWDTAVIEYTSDGTIWSPIKTLDNTSIRHMMYAADNTEIAISTGTGTIPLPISTSQTALRAHYIPLPASTYNNPLFALRIREHLTDADDFIWIDDIHLAGTAISTGVIIPNNLILNPSVELGTLLPTNWLKWGYGNNTALFTYPALGIDGPKAIQLDISAYTDGNAKWYFDDINIPPGQAYRYRQNYISTVPTTLTARYRDSSGAYTYTLLKNLIAKPAGWIVDITVSPPVWAVSMTLWNALSQVGSLKTDNFSLIEISLPSFSEGMVTFSFDDGYRSIYEHAIPILDSAWIKSTQAIITNMLSNTTGLYMTGGQILAMAQSGHEIASHTKSHPALISLSSTQSLAEVTESKNILESMWLQIRTFAYPFWSTNDTIEALIQNGGYAGARGDIPGFNTRATNRWNLYSQSITSTTSINTIKSWIDIAFSKKQWLILEIHRQDINGWEFSNDPALIGQIVAYIQSKNMKTVTLAEGIDLLNP